MSKKIKLKINELFPFLEPYYGVKTIHYYFTFTERIIYHVATYYKLGNSFGPPGNSSLFLLFIYIKSDIYVFCKPFPDL